jgi:hypothetical protein
MWNGVQEGAMWKGVQEGVMWNVVQEGVVWNGVQEGVMLNGVQEGVMWNGVHLLRCAAKEAHPRPNVEHEEGVTSAGGCHKCRRVQRGAKNIHDCDEKPCTRILACKISML